MRGRWSVKKNTGHAGSGRCGGGCPSGGRAASVPRGVGPPAKRTSRGDGCVSYGKRTEPGRGKPRDQARGRRVVLRHGAWWRRRRTEVRADDESSGRTRSPRSGRSAAVQPLEGVLHERRWSDMCRKSEAVAGCARRGPCGPLRWRVTIATSRFSRSNEASICSTPRGTGPRPWLLDRRRPAGRQRPQVREECPLPESPPSIEIAALKWAISRHVAAKALALAGLTSNSPSSSLTCVASARDDQRRHRVNWQLCGSCSPGTSGDQGRRRWRDCQQTRS